MTASSTSMYSGFETPPKVKGCEFQIYIGEVPPLKTDTQKDSNGGPDWRRPVLLDSPEVVTVSAGELSHVQILLVDVGRCAPGARQLSPELED